MRKDLKKMQQALKQVKNPPLYQQVYDAVGNPYTRQDTKKYGVNRNTFVDFAMENAYTPTKKEVKQYKKDVRKQRRKSKS